MEFFTTPLTATNWCIRVAYFRSDYIPSRTNLCKLFWRCVFRAAMFTTLAALLGHLLVAIYVWMDVALGMLAMVTIIGLTVGLLYGAGVGSVKTWRYLRDEVIDDKPQFNPIKEYLQAKKSKICPMITIDGGVHYF